MKMKPKRKCSAGFHAYVQETLTGKKLEVDLSDGRLVVMLGGNEYLLYPTAGEEYITINKLSLNTQLVVKPCVANVIEVK